MYDIRKNIFRSVIYVSFVFLVLNLFYLQVIRYQFYKKRSLENNIRVIPHEAPRGIIYDRNNIALVSSRVSFDLAVVPYEIKDLDATLEKLSVLANIPKKSLYASYKKNYSAPFIPTIVAMDIERSKAFFIDENIGLIKGTLLLANPRRHYQHAQALSHITGYIGKMDEAEYGILREYGYKIREYVGKSGIEKYYNSYLRGDDGGIQVEVDAYSRQVRQLGYKVPQKGNDIYLTIDIGLQELLYEMLKEDKAAAAVMDIKTGEMLALISTPGFNPNIFVDPNTQQQRSALLKDPDFPLLNRFISSAYPPGSIFKIVMAAAALSVKKITRHTSFFCSGVYKLGNAEFKCWKSQGHGIEDLMQGLVHSCNIFFYNVGRLIGAEVIHEYAIKFGLGECTGIDLPGEISGLVPSPFWKRVNVNQPWQGGDTLNFSIGQGYLLITPIQALRMVTIIANKYTMPRPYLVKKIGSRNIHPARPAKVAITGKKDEFDIIQKALFEVVNDPTGTGQRAKVEGVSVCAKTGTAQVPSGETHAWIVGYLPYKDPKLSFIVFIEHGGAGGIKPADTARILCKYLN
ncbi:MAG: penicillin-binding protein 2, partial [Candidatus Omnitrophica bacterium]|nr:penicillin-binding protein 2 [Candidatus Omnitrophota bacterium]